MKRRIWLVGVLVALLWAAPAKADTGIIIRTTGGLSALQVFCSLPLSPCTIVGGALDGTLGQVFLVTTPLDPTIFINLLSKTVGGLTGFVDAEVTQVLNLVDLTSLVPLPIPITLMQDRSSTPYPTGSMTQTAWNSYVNQSTAAVLDGNSQYAAFGHGTMVMGIMHLVAPTAQLMPLKAFHSDGTASLSDILRAIYYGVQNGANVINMSFDTKTSSVELQKALDYANQKGVISAASAGNDGMQEIVYPAALQSDVMGVASTSDQDTRSSFSNYGNAIVWVAAPGEAIVSTYPFNTYAAGWGTS